MRLVVACAVIVASAACDQNPTQPVETLPFAIAERSCGAADGPAVNIWLSTLPLTPLSDPDAPQVRIWIQEAVGRLPGTTWRVPAAAGAWYGLPDHLSEEATSGTVAINSVAADSTISGTVSIQFGARRVENAFSATWRPSKILCL